MYIKTFQKFLFILAIQLWSKYCISVRTKDRYFLNFVKIAIKISFPCKFLKNFKGPSLLCQKFVDLKFLQQSSNLREPLISVIKTGGFFIRFLAKDVRKPKKNKN